MQAEQKISEIEVDKEIASLFEPLLGDTEYLIWTGQPKQGYVFRKSDIVYIPLFLFILFFSIRVVFNVIFGGFFDFNDDFIVKVSLFFFILMSYSISMFYYRFIGDSKRRKSTFYALSNYRIFIRQDYPRRLPIIIKYADLKRVSLVINNQNYGTILVDYVGKFSRFLAKSTVRDAEAAMMESDVVEDVPKLQDIENAQKVYDIIKTYKNQISQN